MASRNVAMRVDPAVIPRGVIDKNTTSAELPSVDPATVKASMDASGCVETDSRVVGPEKLTFKDTFAVASVEGGRCHSSLSDGGRVSREINIENKKRGITVLDWGYSDGGVGLIEQTKKRSADGFFDYDKSNTGLFRFDKTVTQFESKPTRSNQLPNAAKQMPDVPNVGRLTGDENVKDLLLQAQVVDPATNADARAWKERLGDGRGTLFDAAVYQQVGPISFLDTNNDGKVDAYRASATHSLGSVELLDVLTPRKTYRLISEVSNGDTKAQPLVVVRAAPDETSKLLPVIGSTYDWAGLDLATGNLEGWTKSSSGIIYWKPEALGAPQVGRVIYQPGDQPTTVRESVEPVSGQ